MKKTFFRLWLALVLLVLGGVARAEDWQIINLEGKEYLSLENVARFYQLNHTADPGLMHVVLSDNRTRIETVSNPRELLVNGVKEWLSFPTVFQDGQVLISRFDLAKTLEPTLRPTMVGNLAPFQTVVLDAGHGGQDGGGSNAAGMEKDYTLDVIRDLKKSLEAKGLNVVLTRSDDAYIALEQRADFANTIPNAVFVSVHFNSSGDASAAGLEVYAMTPRGAASTADHNLALDQLQQMPGNDFDNASLALANCVQHSLVGSMNVADRGIRRARFAVLRLTHAPAILIEGGFLTNGTDSLSINDPAWRQKLAEGIAVGVRSYQRVATFKEAPKLLADYRRELPPATTPSVPVNVAARSLQPIRVSSRLIPVGNSTPAKSRVLARPASRAKHRH